MMKTPFILLSLGLAPCFGAEPARNLTFPPQPLEVHGSLTPLLSPAPKSPLVISSYARTHPDVRLQPNAYAPGAQTDLYLSGADQRRILASIQALFQRDDSTEASDPSTYPPGCKLFKEHLPPADRTDLFPSPREQRQLQNEFRATFQHGSAPL